MQVSPTRVIRRELLKTPPDQLGVLVEPPPEWITSAVHPDQRPADSRVRLLDTTLARVRTHLRQQLDLGELVILTGHQAEFTHAGVFAKNIAAHVLAEQLGGQAVFLVVDSDVPKATRLVLPQVTDGGLRRVEFAIPGCEPQLPFEDQPPATRAQWLQFFGSLTAMHGTAEHSLLPTFARAWLTTESPQPAYSDALARAGSAVDRALGLGGIRYVRVSDLCATAAFRAFVANLILDADAFARRYNDAQAAYRRRNRVRARGRPVPPLTIRDDAVELPIWAVQSGEPRRRLFVARRADEFELSTDHRVIGRLGRKQLERFEWHAEPWPIEAEGWRLRPRALALTAIARLLLANLFVHGIGGAKYDEMTEELAKDHFGIELCPMCCVSATVRLPLPSTGVRADDLRAARQRSRDLRYNPQRYLCGIPDELLRRREELIRQSQQLRTKRPRDHDARRNVFRELRRLKAQILEKDPWKAAQFDQLVQTIEQKIEHDRIALDREYFYALHSHETLTSLVQAVRRRIRA